MYHVDIKNCLEDIAASISYVKYGDSEKPALFVHNPVVEDSNPVLAFLKSHMKRHLCLSIFYPLTDAVEFSCEEVYKTNLDGYYTEK